MKILLCTDNNYTMPTGILMHSICINNTDEISFYIIVNDIFDDNNKKSLTQIATQYNKKIYFMVICQDDVQSLPMGANGMPSHISIASYYRLFITNYLPKEVNKIIYLDSDMIVRKSLIDLWNIDLSDYAIGVVHDMDEQKHINSHRLSYPMEFGYFNSGMLLINVDYWRKNNILQLFLNYIHCHQDEIKYHDQDVLNVVLYNNKKWVPVKYNFQNGFLYNYDNKNYVSSIVDEVNSTKHNPYVIHYSTYMKPWNINCFHPYSAAWRYYKKKSQWKKNKLIGDDPHTIKDYLRKFLLRHNLWMPRCEYQRIIIRK